MHFALHFRLAALSASLKTGILIQSIALIVGNWMDGPYTDAMFLVTLFVAFGGFCGYLSTFHFLVACSLLAVANITFALGLLGLIIYFDETVEWIVIYWIFCCMGLGLFALALAWSERGRRRSEASTSGSRIDA